MSVVTAETSRTGIARRTSYPTRQGALLGPRGAARLSLHDPGAGASCVLFMAYPFFLGIYLSLTDKMVGFAEFDFVGLDNFRCLWTTPIFQQTVANTAHLRLRHGAVQTAARARPGAAAEPDSSASAGSSGPACSCPGSCRPRSAVSPG